MQGICPFLRNTQTDGRLSLRIELIFDPLGELDNAGSDPSHFETL